MTLINALNQLKAQGTTKLTGMYQRTDINEYISEAIASDESAARNADMDWAQYHNAHMDGYYIVHTNNHYIIVQQYDGFDMATYGDYNNDDDMCADFRRWEIARDAAEIATEKALDGGDYLTWYYVALSELTLADIESTAEFNRLYA